MINFLSMIVGSRIGRAVAAGGALLLAILTFGASQRIAGAKRAKRKMKDADNANAEEIRERKDAALDRLDADGRDVDDKLRGLGGLRDD